MLQGYRRALKVPNDRTGTEHNRQLLTKLSLQTGNPGAPQNKKNANNNPEQEVFLSCYSIDIFTALTSSHPLKK